MDNRTITSKVLNVDSRLRSSSAGYQADWLNFCHSFASILLSLRIVISEQVL